MQHARSNQPGPNPESSSDAGAGGIVQVHRAAAERRRGAGLHPAVWRIGFLHPGKRGPVRPVLRDAIDSLWSRLFRVSGAFAHARRDSVVDSGRQCDLWAALEFPFRGHEARARRVDDYRDG